jgi:hypothetical protein
MTRKRAFLMTSADRAELKRDLAFVANFYRLSPESARMAYLSARESLRAKGIYASIRRSIERVEGNG